MNTGEKNEKGDKAKSGCCGFDSSRMLEMMSTCCEGQDASPDCCLPMMKGMKEMMGSQPCCAPIIRDAEPKEEEK